MKTNKLPFIFFLVFILTSSIAFSCHKGTGAYGLEGHKTWSDTGMSISFDHTTIMSGTTTSCDNFTSFYFQERELIEEEAAKGEGDHLYTLAELRGCAQESYPTFGKVIQKNHQALFPRSGFLDPDVFSQALNQVIQKDSSLNKTCQQSG
jgi:hypothetical protein